MWLALLVFVCMAVQDTAAAMKIRYLTGRCRPWAAGTCEAVNDLGAALSIGVGGASVYRYGISLQTFEILAALALAAVLGTVAGSRLSQRLGGARPDGT